MRALPSAGSALLRGFETRQKASCFRSMETNSIDKIACATIVAGLLFLMIACTEQTFITAWNQKRY